MIPPIPLHKQPANPLDSHSPLNQDNKKPDALMNIIVPETVVQKEVAENSLADILGDNNTELLILIDSNSNFINRRLFWSLDKTKWERCGTVYEASVAVNKRKYNKLKYVLIAVGVNDIDNKGGTEVAEKLTNLTNNILAK